MRRRYLVTGRVQGVGFRQFTAETARALNICGWVRNLPDGNVEVEAEASETLIAEFEKALRRGPALGRVDKLQSDEQPAGSPLPSLFEIRR